MTDYRKPTTQGEANALERLSAAGLTLAEAQRMTDHALLRMPTIGRRTLNYVRSAPRTPDPVAEAVPIPAPARGFPLTIYRDRPGSMDTARLDPACIGLTFTARSLTPEARLSFAAWLAAWAEHLADPDENPSPAAWNPEN